MNLYVVEYKGIKFQVWALSPYFAEMEAIMQYNLSYTEDDNGNAKKK